MAKDEENAADTEYKLRFRAWLPVWSFSSHGKHAEIRSIWSKRAGKINTERPVTICAGDREAIITHGVNELRY